LDIGCGSGTTIDALTAINKPVIYKGVDFIKKHIDWLKENYVGYQFEVQDARHLKEEDKSWDVVWSRHVVDHLNDFEGPMEEQCRVAKKKVLCVLFNQFSEGPVHEIKPIIVGGITYKDEWQNQYSRKLVMKYLKKKEKAGWELIEFREDCSWDMSRNDKGHDTVIVLRRAGTQ
jgi:ubiquinone/menaquinone biosynthesis C-methylase UbiE